MEIHPQQMTVEDVLADIQGDGIGYIIVRSVDYEGTDQVNANLEIDGPSRIYLSRVEAEEDAHKLNSYGCSGEVWEIDLSAFQLRVMPAEKLPARGESESGTRG